MLRLGAFTVAVLLATTTAFAERRRVVLCGAEDPRFFRAVEVALGAWDIELVYDSAQPGSTLPKASHTAASLAKENQAAGVAWIDAAEERALWVYDVASDQIVARYLDRAPPFDEATAAAVA